MAENVKVEFGTPSDFVFFEVLDSVTIACSRKHIEKYYNTEKLASFLKD